MFFYFAEETFNGITCFIFFFIFWLDTGINRALAAGDQRVCSAITNKLFDIIKIVTFIHDDIAYLSPVYFCPQGRKDFYISTLSLRINRHS